VQIHGRWMSHGSDVERSHLRLVLTSVAAAGADPSQVPEIGSEFEPGRMIGNHRGLRHSITELDLQYLADVVALLRALKPVTALLRPHQDRR
jgi:hypothetical protein